jgi:subtilisin family serine protease
MVFVAPLVAVSLPLAISGGAAQAAPSGEARQFTVLSENAGDLASAESAVRAAGGKIVARNAAIGMLTAEAPRNGFRELVTQSPAVAEAAPVRSIGYAPKDTARVPSDIVEKEHQRVGGTVEPNAAAKPAAARMDPLDNQLWGLRGVRSDIARAKQPGDRRVQVGVLDTGIDGTHPDLVRNFDRKLSRNFTKDIPNDPTGAVVDGPCEFRNCVDPADHDDDGHGTHVAGTIAAAVNGLGVSGVAPNVSLVNIRGGQDSGFFFLQPVVNAMTYAGDAGLDVVNMSFYVDPWLYNCQNNPADTAEERAQQRTITTAIQRALNYATGKGVTFVAALGNEHSDLGNPQPDATSPDYPAAAAHTRQIDNKSCLSLPVEGNHVLGVSAIGPSGAKADYSNYGTEQISVAAPGGYFRDYFGTPDFQSNANLILSSYPRNVALANGHIDAAGNITPEGQTVGVQRSCAPNGTCGYYQPLQGTSMASPHVTGVAALIVSQYARYSGGKATMSPAAVQRVLEGTAAHKPCPTPRTVSYENVGRDASFTATCQGGAAFNGFYGHGIADAYAAVTRGGRFVG